MKILKSVFAIAFMAGPASFVAQASGSLREGMEDRLFEKNVEYVNPGHSKNDYQSSPFYVEDLATGKNETEMMRKAEDGEYSHYAQSYHDKPVQIGDEISIVRTSTTQNTMIKTSYDKKGNIITIHAWDRRSGRTLPIGLDTLAEPIVKDEIESTVAKLRIVYNAYGEVISKAAWNKITGEKIAVPAQIPFTNYINEDKYWAWVERQKLYDRSYEDMYVDRGAVRTKRMKKIMRYGNPFGVPQEVEVYEERPIVERHFEEAHYGTDAHVGIFNATFSASLKGTAAAIETVDEKGSHIEIGLDANLARRPIEISYKNMSSSALTAGALTGFDGRNFAKGAKLDMDLSDIDLTYRKEFSRSERGEFGINWLFSLKYLNFEMKLADNLNSAKVEGDVILPMVGIEGVKNMSDHIDLYATAKFFSLSGATLSEMFVGAKYYFHPENVDDWRMSVGYKSYDLSVEDDEAEIKYSGLKLALERGF